jgi:hypothetical protein
MAASTAPNDLRPVEPPRTVTPDERALIKRLLKEPFCGRDELRLQLVDVRVVAEGGDAEGWADTRTLLFALPPKQCPPAKTRLRVPVEAAMADKDNTDIAILLHVVDGRAVELEIYRVDGEPIQLEQLNGSLKWVVVNEELEERL